ncbi:MAG: acyl carrier protein [Desulfobacteraceae bacterium]|nr:acyl carrier protein [Desulfobacteraceae bacterium]
MCCRSIWQEAFKVSLPIRSLFDAPTVAKMAKLIETIHWTVQELKATDNDAEPEEQGEI